MLITNSSSSECFALANTSQARSTHARPQNSFEPLPHLTPSNIHDHLSATIPASLRSRYKSNFRKDFNNTIHHCSPQGQEAMAQRTHHYLLLPFPERQPPTHHQSSTRHHVCNTFSHNIQGNCRSHNCGATSIATSPKHHTDINLHATNDDLVGFFNSVRLNTASSMQSIP